MLSRFNPTQKISSDGAKVFMKGPIKWNPGEKGRCKIEATITQGSVSAKCDTGSYNEGKTEWDCTGDAQGGTFQPGNADSHGEIIVEEGGPAQDWPDKAVQLQH
jgi:hypothetical protein